LPAIFAQHGDGSPLAIAQSHPYTDGSLITKLVVPVYNARIFLPCGVYSQRMQFVHDVIDIVSSVQYARDADALVSKRVCGGEEVHSSAVASADE
jgi:hypothetical protein